jgi:hypothetical protein
MSEHSLTVCRTGPRKFVPRCRCGWEGRNRKGTEFWDQVGALNASLRHQREQGIEPSFPDYLDLDPDSKRG